MSLRCTRLRVRPFRIHPATRKTLGLLAVVGGLVGVHSSPIQAQDRGNSGWHARVAAYLWLSNVDGVNNAAGVQLQVADSSLVLGPSARLEAGKGRWRGILEYTRAGRTNPVVTEIPEGLTGTYDFSITDVKALAAVQVGPFSETHAVEVLGGARWVRQAQELDVAGSRVVRENVTVNWVEPVVGARFFADLGRRFWFTTTGDIGGFGIGSDFTWSIDGEFGMRLLGRLDLAARYRYQEVEYDNGKPGLSRYAWDHGQTQGWLFGLILEV